jgi:dienelactone hydrolase
MIDASCVRRFAVIALWMDYGGLSRDDDALVVLGAVGFCVGGGIANQLAVRMGPNLAARGSVLWSSALLTRRPMNPWRPLPPSLDSGPSKRVKNPFGGRQATAARVTTEMFL